MLSRTYNKYNTVEPIFASDKLITYIMLFLATILAAGILLSTDGNLMIVIGLAAAIALTIITFYRLDWGFYFFFALVLIFDQFGIPNFDSFTFRMDFFKNLKEIRYLPSISAGVMNPIELNLFLMFLVWFISISVNKRTKMLHIQAWGFTLMFMSMLIFSFIHGMKMGGDFLPAMWELRALFYFCVFYLFVPQIIQDKKQIETVMWVFIGGMAFKALQGSARFAKLGFSFGGFETLTNHEDPVFITLLIIFLIGLIILDANRKQRNILMLISPILLTGFFAGQRRAAYAGLAISFIAMFVMIQKKERMVLLKALIPFLIFLSIYSAAFWNSDSRLGSPVKLIKSAISSDPEEESRHYLSNIYRVFERYDLAFTLRQSPVTGLGFGRKYEMPIPLANIHFPLRDYISHNEILWIVVKTGGVGFFIFWFFFDFLVFQGTTLYKKLKDPYLKAVCIISVVAILNQMVVSYYDLQLTYYRNMILLGILTGLVSTINSINRESNLYGNRLSTQNFES